MMLSPFLAVLILLGLLVPSSKTAVMLAILVCAVVGEISNHLADLVLKAVNLALYLGEHLCHLFFFQCGA